MSVCSGTKRDGQPCTANTLAGERYCYNHHPDYAEERRRSARHAATTKHSKISQEIRDVRLTVRDIVEMTLANDLHPLVRKRLTEVVQLLQVYCRLVELEITSMQAEGEKLPVFNARKVLDVGLPEDTKEKVQEWADGEQERVRQEEEDRRVFAEMVAALEEQGIDASALRHFIEQ